MSETGFTPVVCPEPLSAEDAYWHACANVPHEPKLLPIAYDARCQANTAYFFTQPPLLKSVTLTTLIVEGQTSRRGVILSPSRDELRRLYRDGAGLT